MAYVYKYIDITQENNYRIVYIGKVTRKRFNEIDGLMERHAQHKAEEWYKKIGEDNLICEYMHMDSDADADIYETYLIALIEDIKEQKKKQAQESGSEDFHENDWELFNKAKRWGGTNLNIYPYKKSWEVLYDAKSIRLESLISNTTETVTGLIKNNNIDSEIDERLEDLKVAIKEYKSSTNKIKKYLENVKMAFMMKYTDLRIVGFDQESYNCFLEKLKGGKDNE